MAVLTKTQTKRPVFEPKNWAILFTMVKILYNINNVIALFRDVLIIKILIFIAPI